MLFGILGGAIRRVEEDRGWRIGTAKWPVIAHMDPQPPDARVAHAPTLRDGQACWKGPDTRRLYRLQPVHSGSNNVLCLGPGATTLDAHLPFVPAFAGAIANGAS